MVDSLTREGISNQRVLEVMAETPRVAPHLRAITPLEPEVEEFKWHCPGVGLVKEEGPGLINEATAGTVNQTSVFAAIDLELSIDVTPGNLSPCGAIDKHHFLLRRLHSLTGIVPIGVFPRVGYKFDQWHDVGWWHRPLDD